MLFSNCSNKESKKIADYPLYLNTPVTYQDADIIGFETIVSSLNSAISQGAQMIAITSPFGTGKTSVIELLKTQRSIDGKTKSIPNEKIIKIPMWSQTANKEMSSLELHRHLVYEIAKGINPKKGTYIQRRLSHNYGLIKIHINKFRFLIYCTFAIGLWTLGKVIGEQITWITKLISGIDDYLPAISIGLKAIGVLIGLVPVIKSEVIVSTIKSEKDRKIEEDEIIDLYRNEVLQPYKFLYNLPCFQSQKKKYIVVIEDLDRSNSTKSVQDFLRELRKYYTEEQNQSRYLNSVVFIINIKPESLLFKHSQDPASNENEILYAKLFDYVLDLQTINIDDYDTILESLLEKERTSLSSLGIIDSQYHGRITNIAGMQWLIRGKKLDIRMIKHRINKAIILYCSLKKRFNGDVSFEKCAVFSYLTTEYEEEFNLTDDKSYGKLAELRIKSEITVEQCQDIINVNNNDYLLTICELINARLIDSNYRAYFYNYPKNSRVYTYEEKHIQNAILFDEYSDGLDGMVRILDKSNSDIIQQSLEKRERLNLKLPKSVVTSDLLFGEALHYTPGYVLSWIKLLDYSEDGVHETIKQIIRVLHLDSERKYYTNEIAKSFCDIWEFSNIREKDLMDLRKKLCDEFANEIIWYKTLFFSPHQPITIEEYNAIQFGDALQLFDVKYDSLEINDLDNLLNAFNRQKNKDPFIEDMNRIFTNVSSTMTNREFAEVIMRYMSMISRIIPAFERIVVDHIDKDLESDPLFTDYQHLVNTLSEKDITEETLQNISDFDYFSGYSDGVINQLYERGFEIDAIIMKIKNASNVDYDNPSVIKAIRESSDWLQEENLFGEVREHISCHCENVLTYAFMFTDENPLISRIEYEHISDKLSIVDQLKLIPSVLVDKECAKLLFNNWNAKHRNKNDAYSIIMYISNMEPEIAVYCLSNIDFKNSIYFHTLSNKRKETIKHAFAPILNLDDLSNKLQFMYLTKCADKKWISEEIESIQGDIELEQKFVDTINQCHIQSVTIEVLQAIRRLTQMYAMTESIEQLLTKYHYYFRFVASKMLRQGSLVFAEFDNSIPLWETCVKLFVETKNDQLISAFANSKDFLNKGMETQLYKDMQNNKRMMFYSVFQTSDCLKDIACGSYSQSFVVEYLSGIAGFSDAQSAQTFVDIAEENEYILSSNTIYNNTHDKLINPHLKGRYTKKRREKKYQN